MTDTNILKTIVEEKARLNAETKINGKNLVLEITTKNGNKTSYKADSNGQFTKEPELLNGFLKIGVADVENITKSITDVDGVCSETTKQPVIFDYYDPEEISKIRWYFDVITTKTVDKVNINAVVNGDEQNENGGE